MIIQLYHNTNTLAIAGQGGHVSLFLWNLATAQSLSFHMAMGRGANGHPVLGGALYPFEPRLIYQLTKRNCTDYHAVYPMPCSRVATVRALTGCPVAGVPPPGGT
ncbi:hypothetical protein [Corallococcus sp. CA053C]|uniref:hypothetical protein n=1 Tax=Corallococcus sp. CA053C TaxID=2316732 RepID=UPI0011C3A1DA|nr:hypothetical protein [Corallococcus sp. CA053C]